MTLSPRRSKTQEVLAARARKTAMREQKDLNTKRKHASYALDTKLHVVKDYAALLEDRSAIPKRAAVVVRNNGLCHLKLITKWLKELKAGESDSKCDDELRPRDRASRKPFVRRAAISSQSSPQRHLSET